LDRAPDNSWLVVQLSACCSHLGQYAEARTYLGPLLGRVLTEQPQVCASAWNNMAFALAMENANAGAGSADLQQADELSARSFGMYPCVLAYRGTRSLVLSAVGRWDEALQLLDYVHYATASARERSQQELVRAFALLKSGCTKEAHASAGRSLSLDPSSRTFLRSLGLIGPLLPLA
jgi:tetratricopeptide (TPR) repeat protein